MYRVRHVSSGTELAVKCCFGSQLTPNTLSLIRNEIALHSMIHHPTIICLYGWFEDRRSNVYIVLELAKRGDLFNVIYNNPDAALLQ